MKIEAGKYYKTRDGRKVGPMKRGRDGSVSAFWVCDAYPLEDAASEWFECGSFWPDGHFNRNDKTAARDLIAEWTVECAHPFCGDTCGTPAIGTLAELDVKPGDVVECQGQVFDVMLIANETKHPRRTLCNIGDVCALSRDGKNHQSVKQSTVRQWKIISRATPKPSIDLTAIREPFGLLDKATQDALIAHGGPYEYYDGDDGWLPTRHCSDVPRYAHRVKPGPKRETVTNREMYITPRGCIASNGLMEGARRCTITYDTIDGVIDMATYRVVAK